MLTGSLIYIWFLSPRVIFYFPTMPTGKTDSPQRPRCVSPVPVRAHVHGCVLSSVNPFCQVSARPFLSKLPAWSRSLLCWWEEWEEKAFGIPVAPSPSPGPSAHEGRAWDLLRAGALYGSCEWRFNRLSPGHPCIPFHTSETGGKRQLHTYSAASPSLQATSLLYCHVSNLLNCCEHFANKSSFCQLVNYFSGHPACNVINLMLLLFEPPPHYQMSLCLNKHLNYAISWVMEKKILALKWS